LQKLFVGVAILRCRMIKYYLICSSRCAAQETYGALVEYLGERVFIPDLSVSRQKVLALIGHMRRGRVTPAAVRDIVEDWLVR